MSCFREIYLNCILGHDLNDIIFLKSSLLKCELFPCYGTILNYGTLLAGPL